MLSPLCKPTQDAPPNEEEDIPEPEPYHTSSSHVPPTDPYFTFLASITQLNLSFNQLSDDFYSTASHFIASQRRVEQHLTQIQCHFGYEIPSLT